MARCTMTTTYSRLNLLPYSLKFLWNHELFMSSMNKISVDHKSTVLNCTAGQTIQG